MKTDQLISLVMMRSTGPLPDGPAAVGSVGAQRIMVQPLAGSAEFTLDDAGVVNPSPDDGTDVIRPAPEFSGLQSLPATKNRDFSLPNPAPNSAPSLTTLNPLVAPEPRKSLDGAEFSDPIRLPRVPDFPPNTGNSLFGNGPLSGHSSGGIAALTLSAQTGNIAPGPNVPFSPPLVEPRPVEPVKLTVATRDVQAGRSRIAVSDPGIPFRPTDQLTPTDQVGRADKLPAQTPAALAIAPPARGPAAIAAIPVPVEIFSAPGQTLSAPPARPTAISAVSGTDGTKAKLSRSTGSPAAIEATPITAPEPKAQTPGTGVPAKAANPQRLVVIPQPSANAGDADVNALVVDPALTDKVSVPDRFTTTTPLSNIAFPAETPLVARLSVAPSPRDQSAARPPDAPVSKPDVASKPAPAAGADTVPQIQPPVVAAVPLAMAFDGRAAPWPLKPDAEPDQTFVAGVPLLDPATAGPVPPAGKSASTPFPEVFAGRAFQTIAQAVEGLQDRPIELTLNPAELGRVRLTLQPGDGSMAVAIAVERPETLELLRRHIDQLASQLRDIGYQNLSFEFAGQGNDFSDPDPDSGAETEEFTGAWAQQEQLSTTSPEPIRLTVGPATGVDIRL